MKTARWIVLLAGWILVSGCAVIPHMGIIYTEAQHPMRLDPTEKQVYLQDKEYKILGQVRGEATVENYLGWVALGDYGITTAYNNALRNAGGADLLLDVHVDQHTMRVLGFYIKATTVVTGTAVKIEGSPGAIRPPTARPPRKKPRPQPERPAKPAPQPAKEGGGEEKGGSEETPWGWEK